MQSFKLIFGFCVWEFLVFYFVFKSMLKDFRINFELNSFQGQIVSPLFWKTRPPTKYSLIKTNNSKIFFPILPCCFNYYKNHLQFLLRVITYLFKQKLTNNNKPVKKRWINKNIPKRKQNIKYLSRYLSDFTYINLKIPTPYCDLNNRPSLNIKFFRDICNWQQTRSEQCIGVSGH